MKPLSLIAGRAIDPEAHRRDPPIQVPCGPSGVQFLLVGQPTSRQALLSENMRAPAISEFPVRDTLPRAKAQEPEIRRPYSSTIKDEIFIFPQRFEHIS